MNITVKKLTMIRKIHDLTNGRASTLWHHTVYHALALGHPGAGKTHLLRLLYWPGLNWTCQHLRPKNQKYSVYSIVHPQYHGWKRAETEIA
jgi:hypothetical protein